MTTTIGGSYPAVNSDSDATINGLTVGKGGGAVATNTAVGFTALFNNTTASNNTATGATALYANTTGVNNSALGLASLRLNTTGNNNVAIGQGALYSNTTSSFSTAIGREAGYSTTGQLNTFIGNQAGYFVTTGSKNTILGTYSGNQGGLDIRTASNNIVLSDGDGNPRMFCNSNGRWEVVANGISNNANSEAFRINGGSSSFIARFFGVSGGGENGANSAMGISRDSVTSRSINAGGTINATGADYAEYMFKAGDFVIAKGDVCGIDANGKITNVFSDAISFVVKSTDPSYVGGDSWGANIEDTAELEIIRQTVDRIAFAGQVPVNVIGATAGQYIVPINDNGSIKGQAVSSPTFEQYQVAVGKVIAIEADGRARIIVKVA